MLNEIIAKILLLEESSITDDLNRSDIEEWDSMTHLVLISEIEQSLNCTFEDDDIATIKTIGDIKAILDKNGIKY